MKQDPSRGGGSTLSPAYSAALEQLYKKRTEKKPSTWDNALGALKGVAGLAISPVATVADIAAKPFELIPGVPDFNPESVGSVNLFVQGGKSLKHVTGDAYQLGRSIITGKDTLSESPSARAYQAAGGGLPGVLAAAGPYLDVGSVVAPMALGAARGAGLVAPKAIPYTPLTAADLTAARETFGAPTNAYRATRNALAEDMAQTTPEVTAPANRPIIEGIRPTVPPQPKRVPTYDEAVAFAQEKMAYDLQREAERALEKSVGNTQTPKDYADFFARQGMDKTASPTVNWNAVNLAKEQDIQQFLMNPMDEMLLSPEMQTKLAAQRAFRAEILPFLERRGLTEKFATIVPERRTSSDIANMGVLSTMFEAVPELKGLYVDTMRSYGIGDVTAPAVGRMMNPVEELAAAQARAQTHIGTVSRGPVDELSATFPDIGYYHVNEGGVPDPSSSRTNTFSMPVYDVGGKKVAFGPKNLGRYAPEFKNTDVEIIPIDPYVITGQSAGSKLGDEYAQLFFDAVYQDTPNSPQSGQMSALLYAASRGDKVAMQELQTVANANRALMAQERSAYYSNKLAFMGDQPSSYDWAANDPAQMVVVGKDETGAAITRPATIDDLFVVHQTSYKPTYDKNGNIVIKPTGDHVYIDPATGKQAVDAVTGEVLDPRRDTIHFTLNHPVPGHIERPTPTGKTYSIVVPLRDVLDANPKSLDNLLAVDTWFTPKPGEGLVLPMKSGQVVELSSVADYAKQQGLTYIEIKPEDLADTPYEILSYRNDIATQNTMQNNALVQEALRQVGRVHNQRPDYQTNLFPIGENINRDVAIGRRIAFLAGEEIPAQYPSLGTSVSNDLHFYTPIAQFEKNFGRYITPGESRRVLSQNLWSLSPNARKRLFRRNTFMSGKFEMNESDWGL